MRLGDDKFMWHVLNILNNNHKTMAKRGMSTAAIARKYRLPRWRVRQLMHAAPNVAQLRRCDDGWRWFFT